jgi:uncharacterized protein YndB with AHSA1/START domain
VVSTFIFDPMPDKEAVTTVILDEHDGKTKLTSTTLFQSLADRDGYLSTGANAGAAQTMDRLEELLRTIS